MCTFTVTLQHFYHAFMTRDHAPFYTPCCRTSCSLATATSRMRFARKNLPQRALPNVLRVGIARSHRQGTSWSEHGRAHLASHASASRETPRSCGSTVAWRLLVSI